MEVCSYCYGAVFAEYDPDDVHRLVRKCINCGREVQRVEQQAEHQVIIGRVKPVSAAIDQLAAYEQAARRAIVLHDEWQGKEREAADLRKQACEAWTLSVKARQALDEYLERINGQQPPEAEPPKGKQGHAMTQEARLAIGAKARARAEAKRAAVVGKPEPPRVDLSNPEMRGADAG